MYCVCCVECVVLLCSVFMVGVLCLPTVGCNLYVFCVCLSFVCSVLLYAVLVFSTLIALSCSERVV